MWERARNKYIVKFNDVVKIRAAIENNQYMNIRLTIKTILNQMLE